MDPRYQSSIPAGTTEQTMVNYQHEGNFNQLKQTACLIDGEVVGERFYEADGTCIIEKPLRRGRQHGILYTWYESGALESAQPYVDGRPHGTARQWAQDGTLMGIYTLDNGSGFDIWRDFREDGTIFIAEIHTLRDGLPHGFEWWLNEDEKTVVHERYWYEGQVHGIERRWDSDGRLEATFPQFWIYGQRVSPSAYQTAAAQNATLPPFQEKDQQPERQFPEEIWLSAKRVEEK
jgi:antitoxin component YwqK of YwqJK toxin-antitoxin module